MRHNPDAVHLLFIRSLSIFLLSVGISYNISVLERSLQLSLLILWIQAEVAIVIYFTF